MDKIILKNLNVFARHGVLQFEKEEGQDFFLTIEIEKNLKLAGSTDKLSTTVDYAKIADIAVHVFAEKSYNLIEKAAEDVIEAIIERCPSIRKVTVEVSKPNAPLNVKFETAMVRLSRKLHRAYLGIGTNMGDLKANLEKCVESISIMKETRITDVSNYIKSKAWGNEYQDDYLNGVVCIETWLEPYELLGFCQEIEKLMGRVRKEKWGPRIIDVDILLYDDAIISQPDLIIPHPYMHKRDFVLAPLKEIAPFAIHPLLRKHIIDIDYEEYDIKKHDINKLKDND